ncbi:MAG: glycosyltransferase family 2 protein [Candidatus Omnitrophica bacterium]|nr:glycosyltransferase family 2 protein [Candidatus Omnitrophota bacterium]
MADLVSVLMPVYNEAPFIEPIVRKVCASPVEKELIVVDDGSTDGTGAKLERLARELPLRVITHARNQGKGRAIRSAIEHSRGDILLIQDGDLEYDPEDYPVLLKPLFDRRTEVVFGSRFLGAHRASYFWHRVGNWVLTTLVNLLFNASLTDVETGFKAFRREVLEGLSLRAIGFEFEVEFTCRILRRRHMIFEVPITYYGRSYAEGKKITWKDGVYALWVILGCRLRPTA